MPLIKCPECGREISDKAENCPGCGCPASEWKKNVDDKQNIPKNDPVKAERDYVFGKYGIRIEKVNGRFIVFEDDSIKCDCLDSVPYISNILHERGEDIYSFWTPGINPVVRFVPENEEEKRVFKQLFSNEIQKYLDGNKEIKKSNLSNEETMEDERTVILEILKKYSRNERTKAANELQKHIGMDIDDAYEIIDGYFRGKDRVKISSGKKTSKPEIIYEPKQNISPYALRCPSCRSINLQVVSREIRGAREAKTKTTTSLNLNPLKPFTLLNHKEKVVKKARPGSIYVKWRCADCGHMFERKES